MSVTVSKGNSVYKIQSGGTDVAEVVVHGGAMIVRSDGSADETLVGSGGQLTVAAGGAASGTVRYFSNDSVLDEPIAPQSSQAAAISAVGASRKPSKNETSCSYPFNGKTCETY